MYRRSGGGVIGWGVGGEWVGDGDKGGEGGVN